MTAKFRSKIHIFILPWFHPFLHEFESGSYDGWMDGWVITRMWTEVMFPLWSHSFLMEGFYIHRCKNWLKGKTNIKQFENEVNEDVVWKTTRTDESESPLSLKKSSPNKWASLHYIDLFVPLFNVERWNSYYINCGQKCYNLLLAYTVFLVC